MVDKKGIYKTLEALIALFITLAVLAIFVQPTTPGDLSDPKGFLTTLRENDAFRNCITQKNVSCITNAVNNSLEDNFNFAINLSDKANIKVVGLPEVQVFGESIFVAGNVTNSTQTILRVYYWSKS